MHAVIEAIDHPVLLAVFPSYTEALAYAAEREGDGLVIQIVSARNPALEEIYENLADDADKQ